MNNETNKLVYDLCCNSGNEDGIWADWILGCSLTGAGFACGGIAEKGAADITGAVLCLWLYDDDVF